MKNKLKKCVICLLLIGFGVLIGVSFSKKENVLEEEIFVKKDVNTLSMMLETEAGSGNYELTTRSEWPTEGYVFNPKLSVCEHGGELSWDDENKIILMSGNMSDKCYVYFDVYIPPTLADYVKSLYTGTQGENSIYYHDETLEDGAKDNSYRYSGGNGTCIYNGQEIGPLAPKYPITYQGCIDIYKETLSDGTEYYYGSVKEAFPLVDIAIWDGENNKCVTSLKKYDVVKANETITQSHCDGQTVMYSDEFQAGIIMTLAGHGTWDGVLNYVCFGSDEVECPEDNLYRIIGVFDTQVKLVKAEPASSELLGTDGAYDYEYEFFWNNATKTNIWSESNLNKINLNTNYINNLGIKWTSKIFDATWIVGGKNVSMGDTNTSQDFYSLEVVNPFTSSNIEFKYTPAMALTNGTSSKIGLPYVSDYLFAKKKDYWGDISLGSYSDSWMAFEGDEWTITRHPNDTSGVLAIRYGSVPGTLAAAENLFIKPTFYLNSNVTYISGDGTSQNPIRIN